MASGTWTVQPRCRARAPVIASRAQSSSRTATEKRWGVGGPVFFAAVLVEVMLRLLPSAPAPAEPAVEADGEAKEAAKSRSSDPLWPLASLARAGDTGALRTLLATVGPSMLRVI